MRQRIWSYTRASLRHDYGQFWSTYSHQLVLYPRLFSVVIYKHFLKFSLYLITYPWSDYFLCFHRPTGSIISPCSFPSTAWILNQVRSSCLSSCRSQRWTAHCFVCKEVLNNGATGSIYVHLVSNGQLAIGSAEGRPFNSTGGRSKPTVIAVNAEFIIKCWFVVVGKLILRPLSFYFCTRSSTDRAALKHSWRQVPSTSSRGRTFGCFAWWEYFPSECLQIDYRRWNDFLHEYVAR